MRVRVLPVRVSNQCLCDHFVLIFIFKLSVLAAISHHEQVALEFLLLSGIKLALLVVTVIFLLFPVFGRLALLALLVLLVLLVLLLIVAETRLVRLLALLGRHATLSITKVRPRELLIWRPRRATSSTKHLLLLLHELLA